MPITEINWITTIVWFFIIALGYRHDDNILLSIGGFIGLFFAVMLLWQSHNIIIVFALFGVNFYFLFKGLYQGATE